MKALQKIHDYMREVLGSTDEEIKNMDGSSVSVAEEIAMYAHHGQHRENGEAYLAHPFNCMLLFQNFVGIVPDDYFCIDKDLMEEHGIPFDGVQEVCMLHDVPEDTELTIEDIAEVYSELGLQNYFDLYIKTPLLFITHDKSVPYEDYIRIVNKHPVSAIVKMMDMTDNSNLLGLASLDEEKIARTKRYVDYIKTINDKYHFIENVYNYKIEFNNRKKQ